MNKYKEVINYLNLEGNNPIGCSRLAPLIKMVNEDMKIVEELLETSDFEHKANLLSFLDYGLRAIINCDRFGDKLKTDNTLEAIIYVLKSFKKLENKWEINGEQFTKYLLDNLEV
jgi:hypothetical protein